MPKQRNSVAIFSLLAVSAVWGAAFVLMKDAIEKQPFYDFLATRFLIAAAVMIDSRRVVLFWLRCIQAFQTKSFCAKSLR